MHTSNLHGSNPIGEIQTTLPRVRPRSWSSTTLWFSTPEDGEVPGATARVLEPVGELAELDRYSGFDVVLGDWVG